MFVDDINPTIILSSSVAATIAESLTTDTLVNNVWKINIDFFDHTDPSIDYTAAKAYGFDF
jgi:hypothetical protein